MAFVISFLIFAAAARATTSSWMVRRAPSPLRSEEESYGGIQEFEVDTETGLRQGQLWDAPRVACKWGYQQEIGKDEVQYKVDHGNNWGNRLSNYWEARATALISGRKFTTLHNRSFPESWLHFLPTEVPALPERTNIPAYEKACTTCKACTGCHGGQYPHHCGKAAWIQIRDVVQQDTHAAMEKFEEVHPNQKPQSIGDESSNEVHVLFHVRLEFVHPQISWPAKSFFEGKLPRNTRRITLLHMPYLTEEQNLEKVEFGYIHKEFSPVEQSNITELLNGYNELLHAMCPDCEKVERKATSQYHAWALIARHRGPVFCMGSTFCLWAGLANEHGPIYFPADFVSTTTRYMHIMGGRGRGFFWHRGDMLNNLNISTGFSENKEFPFQLMQASKIVDWLRVH